MSPSLIQHLATMRVAIGYLGERDQHGWWGSSFFANYSGSFLDPVFARTRLLAQCTGATQAASAVHDERIGIGSVYHLFRLPEDLEQAIHQALQDASLVQTVEPLVATTEAALAYLQAEHSPWTGTDAGPVRVGDVQSVRNIESWKSTLGCYLQGFQRSAQVYPFFGGSGT